MNLALDNSDKCIECQEPGMSMEEIETKATEQSLDIEELLEEDELDELYNEYAEGQIE
jgi:hypothetical protein